MAESGIVPFPEPSGETADTATLLRTYLAYFRSELRRRVEGLDPVEQRASVLPSGWTPIELLHHLVHVEQRWIRWGFLAEPVAEPWGDAVDGRWAVGDDVDLAVLLERLDDGAATTERVLADHPLDARAATGGRFADAPPTLAWIGFHLVQEYARHLGQLDVVVELAGGPTGEPYEDG